VGDLYSLIYCHITVNKLSDHPYKLELLHLTGGRSKSDFNDFYYPLNEVVMKRSISAPIASISSSMIRNPAERSYVPVSSLVIMILHIPEAYVVVLTTKRDSA